MPVCLYSLSQFPLSSRLGMQIHVLYWINWISSDNRHPCSLPWGQFEVPVPSSRGERELELGAIAERSGEPQKLPDHTANL